ncbi:uncharacterized protein B0P05DRAFT_473283 [Gilbertella persicaria]|uniref:uncharacterized protein n=1 Tax=Gilbertella persicaria TaxID=101096 RepID=UPI00221FCE29|nr:uncharacterized protein B0P05DRAFT_473283 [Gilbertella persicaria]KAI8074329.1 hypothetical protein B0P05DRAFT_473283 [Gilbertella persicaria]
MSSNDIFEAAAAGDLEFLKRNLPLVNQKNERNWTPLHFTARFGQLEAAKFLKEKGADLLATNAEGKTAAQVAKIWGNTSVAELLSVKEELKESPFPENHVSVFAGNPLNRFGWKRNKPEFLAPMAHASTSKYIVLNELKALYDAEGNLRYLTYNDVSSAVDRVYSQESAIPDNSNTILVFLGMDERQEESVAFWALDVTPRGAHEQEYKELIQGKPNCYSFFFFTIGLESKGLEFCRTLPRAFTMDRSTSSIIAQAASMIDWNARNMYCSACGRHTVSEEAGYKRHCPPNNATQQCISHTGIQNFTYPRTGNILKKKKKNRR